MSEMNLDLLSGQMDAFFPSAEQTSRGVKSREDYKGDYDSYLNGVRQVEERIKNREKKQC